MRRAKTAFAVKRVAIMHAAALVVIPVTCFASETIGSGGSGLVSHPIGYISLGVFCLAYILVAAEEYTHLRKSKPVILAAGIIWGLVAWASASSGNGHAVEEAARHNLLEYAELMLFLLVAMTYINALEEREFGSASRFSQTDSSIPPDSGTLGPSYGSYEYANGSTPVFAGTHEVAAVNEFSFSLQTNTKHQIPFMLGGECLPRMEERIALHKRGLN